MLALTLSSLRFVYINMCKIFGRMTFGILSFKDILCIIECLTKYIMLALTFSSLCFVFMNPYTFFA